MVATDSWTSATDPTCKATGTAADSCRCATGLVVKGAATGNFCTDQKLCYAVATECQHASTYEKSAYASTKITGAANNSWTSATDPKCATVVAANCRKAADSTSVATDATATGNVRTTSADASCVALTTATCKCAGSYKGTGAQSTTALPACADLLKSC